MQLGPQEVMLQPVVALLPVLAELEQEVADQLVLRVQELVQLAQAVVQDREVVLLPPDLRERGRAVVDQPGLQVQEVQGRERLEQVVPLLLVHQQALVRQQAGPVQQAELLLAQLREPEGLLAAAMKKVAILKPGSSQL